MMEYRVRDMTPAEYPLLADFLHMAIFVPPGQQPPPRDKVGLEVCSVPTSGISL